MENVFDGINARVVVMGDHMRECLIVSREMVKSLTKIENLKEASDADRLMAYDIIERIGVSLFIEANRGRVWDSDRLPEQPKPAGVVKEDDDYITVRGVKWPKFVKCKDCGKSLAYSESKSPDKYDPVYYRCGTCKSYTKPTK